MATVLVTGATGFLASHVILQLIERGHTVRGTARSKDKAARLNAALSAYAGQPIEVELARVDLTSDDGWAAAMEGVDFVQHIASPFPPGVPKTADDLIIPARDGALRALKFARAAGVKRVVLTSSVAAVDNGWGDRGPDVFDETCWTKLDGESPVSFYAQSKYHAERAAWDYVAGDGAGLELAVINPVGIFGPLITPDVSTSVGLIIQALSGRVPAFPRIHQGVVDVRDVAKAHVEAMERPEAAGERFIVCERSLWLSEIGRALRSAYPDRKIPTADMPGWLARIAGLFNPSLRFILPNLNRRRIYDADKARRMLGIDFIPAQTALIASAESLISIGKV